MIQGKYIWTFAVLVIVFLIGYSFYQKAVYFLYAHIDFFSNEFRSQALRGYNSKSAGYSFVYIFRELLLISALAYFIHSLKQSEQLKTLKERQLTAELSYLKAQLQPHFFFNTLNNIYGLALDDSKDTAPMVAKLSEMMRYILYHSDQQRAPLQHEIAFLGNYLDIERIRHRGHVSIDFDIEGECDGKFIAPLVLLPFVENAFKHGVNKMVDAAFVEIVLMVDPSGLHFQIRNSKAAKKNTGGEKKRGIGLMNVEKRLALLYPDEHQLDIAEEKAFFQVNLILSWKT